MSNKLTRAGCALLLAASLAGCVNTTAGGQVGATRKQLMLLSPQEVEKLSAQSYLQAVGKAKNEHKLNTDATLGRRVRGVAERLIAQAPVFRNDVRNWKWEVNITESDELNAYAMAGGKIMVYSGIVKRLALTDDEMAAIIGHEMAHALREHSREGMSQAYAQQMGLNVFGKLAGLSAGQLNMAAMAADVALTKPNSRTMESEADVIGLELMARAGYNPNAAVALWQKMMKAGAGTGPSFMSTHPSGPERIAELERQIPTVLPLYNAARGKKRG